MKLLFKLTSDDVKAAIELYVNTNFGLPDGGTVEFPSEYTWSYAAHDMEYTTPATPAAPEPAEEPAQVKYSHTRVDDEHGHTIIAIERAAE